MLMNQSRNRLYRLALCAVFVALSFVLSMVQFLSLPFGGSITLFSMLAASFCGYFCGAKWGITAGVALGLLNMVTGSFFYHPVQVVLDYILAFGCLGLSGFFRNLKGGLYIGYIVAVSGRFLCSFLSGVVFFAEYAPEGMNPSVYSFVYNISYMGVEALLTLAILALSPVRKMLDTLKKMTD